MRGGDTATSNIVVAVGAEDISGAFLGSHDALRGVGMQGDLIPGKIRDRLNDVDLRVEVAVVLVVVQQPAGIVCQKARRQ